MLLLEIEEIDLQVSLLEVLLWYFEVEGAALLPSPRAEAAA